MRRKKNQKFLLNEIKRSEIFLQIYNNHSHHTVWVSVERFKDSLKFFIEDKLLIHSSNPCRKSRKVSVQTTEHWTFLHSLLYFLLILFSLRKVFYLKSNDFTTNNLICLICEIGKFLFCVEKLYQTLSFSASLLILFTHFWFNLCYSLNECKILKW